MFEKERMILCYYIKNILVPNMGFGDGMKPRHFISLYKQSIILTRNRITVFILFWKL